MARPPDSHSLIVVLFVNKNVLFLGMVSSLYVAGHKVEPAWHFAVPHISQQRGRGFSTEARRTEAGLTLQDLDSGRVTQQKHHRYFSL